MTWFAIKGPDGEIVGVGPAPIRAWQAARDSVDGDLSVHRAWNRHDRYDDSVAACKSIGYRCVDVQLVEPGQASALEQAFIQGAAWWEWHKEGATMWQSDRALALEEAERRTANGTLGKSPESTAPTGGAESKEGKA